MLIAGALVTLSAWRTMEGNLQLAVALFGQLFWLLAYLDWQRGRWAPRAIRKFLTNNSSRLPCQILVVVEEIELIRDAGVLVVDRDKLRFQGQQMEFTLPAQNVAQILPDPFGLDGRCIKLKCSDAKLLLRVVPYERFDSDRPATYGDLNALMDALRMEMTSKAGPGELPSWPFQGSLWRRLRIRGWLLFSCALACFSTIPYALSLKDEVFKYFIVTQAPFLGIHIFRGAGRARRAGYFVRNTLEEAERRALRTPESILAAPASIAPLN